MFRKGGFVLLFIVSPRPAHGQWVGEGSEVESPICMDGYTRVGCAVRHRAGIFRAIEKEDPICVGGYTWFRLPS